MSRISSCKHTIVCIPHAGAGASAFRTWQTRLGSSFVPIVLPGREIRHSETLLCSIQEMAAYVVDTICRDKLAEVTLYGHSMGGLVAYEAARLLQGWQPSKIRRLAISGCRSPTSPSSLHLSAITDDAVFMAAIADLGNIPSEIATDVTIVKYALPILRADIGAADSYLHEGGELLRMPLIVIGGDDDPFVPLDALTAWRDLAGASFEWQAMSGGHFFIFEHSDRILQLLRV